MLPAALLALTLTATGEVSADAAREAQNLAHRSALEYDLGHAEDALRDIERAYLLDPLPGLLFNLGQCHRKLEHWKQAQEAYQAFLHYRPDAPNRETVLKLIEEMKREQLAAAIPELGQGRPLPAPAVQREPAPPPPVPALHGEPRSPLPEEPVAAPAPPVKAAPPAPAPATEPLAAAQPWPDEQHPASKATAWPWVFGITAAVAAGFSIAGFAQMVNYSSLKSGSTYGNPTPLATAQGAEQSYAWGEPLGIVGAVLTAGCVGGMIWTW